MTGHYAKIHDATIREAFDRYQAQRVNIHGEAIGYDPDSPAVSAEWVKHNLNRVRDSLPTDTAPARPSRTARTPTPASPARTSRPPPYSCRSTGGRAATNRRLIAQADAKGQQRLAENLRRVQANLERIIPALEVLEKDGPGDDPS